MKILYYDCFAGVSGDMNLGALINLGVDAEYLTGELQKLKLDGYEVRVSEQQRKGIAGTRAEVILTGHEHLRGHGSHHRGHRNLNDIAKIIRESDLADRVKTTSLDIFGIVAQAEAKIHGKTLEEVHFHEVGAVDSIVDIVGAAVCIDRLAPDRIIASPVEMGGGFVNCVHGTFPVPAPAALEIMKGKPMKLGAVPFETATPTGVAILVALADEFAETPAFTVVKTGYGIGCRDTEIPNVLRVCLGESDGVAPASKTADAAVVECNIDDMNPECYAYVMERLFEAGADDVYMQNVMMKKSRPAVMISALCAPQKIPAIEQVLFAETTTLGARYRFVKKTALDRRSATVDTPWGKVRVKEAYLLGEKLRTKPEYDDCAAIAHKYGVGIEKVYACIRRLIAPDTDNSL